MDYPNCATLFAVINACKETGRVRFIDEPAIYIEEDAAMAHMKYDTTQPVVIYAMTPIWQSKREMKFERVQLMDPPSARGNTDGGPNGAASPSPARASLDTDAGEPQS